MEHLVAQCLFLLLLETLDTFEFGGILRDKGTPLEHIGDVGEVAVMCELLDVFKQLALRDTSERVLDPAKCE